MELLETWEEDGIALVLWREADDSYILDLKHLASGKVARGKCENREKRLYTDETFQPVLREFVSVGIQMLKEKAGEV